LDISRTRIISAPVVPLQVVEPFVNTPTGACQYTVPVRRPTMRFWNSSLQKQQQQQQQQQATAGGSKQRPSALGGQIRLETGRLQGLWQAANVAVNIA
jgi:hypothetical protein